MLHKLQYLCRCGFTEGLGGPYSQDSAEVHAAGKDIFSLADAAGNALSGKGYGIKAGSALKHGSVHRNLLSGADHDDFSNLNVFRMDGKDFAVPLDVCAVGTDVHKVRDGLPGAAFGNLLEEFSDLEEKHDEDGLRELRLCTRHESDAKGAQGSDTHEEILAECLSVKKALRRLLERVPAHD